MYNSDQKPLVTVICISHNHSHFIAEAIESILKQSYAPIELIIADDASSDNSEEVIRKTIDNQQVDLLFLPNKENIGHCKTFNRAFEHSSGKFIIDLAADDMLEPKRVEAGVSALADCGEEYGVHFTDAMLIDKNSNYLNYHRTSDFFQNGKVPEGDVYEILLKKFFICPPTMMYTRSVIDTLGGYDERLYYEDFDFWVRSARDFKYCYSPEVLARKRIHRGSKSASQYKPGSKMIESTLAVCKKAFRLNRNLPEFEALGTRIRYELRQALLTGNVLAVWGFLKLYRKNNKMILQMKGG
jgi:glycosyltransferase involved in cell wall biosynthesis